MEKATIRPAKKTDRKTIKNLVRRTGINPFGIKWRRILIAENAAGSFIGCVQLKTHRDGSVELGTLAVVEAYRSQGVARRLIEHLLAESPRPIYLTCYKGLRTLYEKFGFKVIEDEPVAPFFQRIRLLFRLVKLLTGKQNVLIMRLE